MRAIDPSLATVLASDTAQLSWALQITRLDGAVFRFTNNDVRFVDTKGQVWRSDISFDVSALSLSLRSPDQQTCTVRIMMSDDGIAEADIRMEKFNSAAITVYAYDRSQQSAFVQLFNGVLGEMRIIDSLMIETDCGPLAQMIAPTVGYEFYLPTCNWSFGDVDCNRDNKTALSGWQQKLTVAAVTNNRSFTMTSDTYSRILQRFDGANTSTVFTDEAVGGSVHTWTPHGTVQMDTSTSKFGGASGKFAVGTDWIDTPATADFNWGTNVGTFDTWFNCLATTGAQSWIVGLADVAGNSPFSVLRQNSNFIVGDWCDGLAHYSVTGTTQYTNLLNPGWHHLEFARVPGNILRLWIDGIQQGADLVLPGNLSMWNFTPGFSIGRLGGLAGSGWIGNLDQLRLTIGFNRHTSNFVPPPLIAQPSAANWWAFGFVQWLTGNNAGTISKVSSSAGNTINLVAPTLKAIQVGDTAVIVPGCDKIVTTCRDKYANVLANGGYAFVPGAQMINFKSVVS